MKNLESAVAPLNTVCKDLCFPFQPLCLSPLSLCSRYARKHFNGGSDHLLKDIQQAMGLLAFSTNTRVKRYQRLFSPSRWAGLIDQFRQENFALYQLSQRSVLSVTLQAGLSALKTPYPSHE